MADRRADETPLAPRRSLSGPATEDQEPRRPLSERVSAAVSATGSAISSAATPSRSGNTSSERSATRTSSRAAGPPTPAGRPTSGSTASTGSVRSGSAAPRARGTRRARLRLVHVDPWSIMKTAFLLSIAFGIVTVVAVAVVWSVLGAAGVWDSINQTVTDVLGSQSATSFDVENYVGTSRVLGFTMIVAVVDVVLITAIATLGAFLYNLAAALLGGLEVTLAEDER
jgi:Transmembrane domain of unknown function (DUF3566)